MTKAAWRVTLPFLLLVAPAAQLWAQARWTPHTVGTSAEFRGLHAVTADIVWASGVGGVVAHTANGGSSWRVDTIPGAERLFLVDVHARNEREAWVVGTAFEGSSAGRIFHTTDGGRTWTTQYADSTAGIFLDGVAFVDARRGVAFGDPLDGRLLVLVTTDAGATWRRVGAESLPPVGAGEAAFAASGTSITARGREIWIGTGGGAVARVFHSPDGGDTWRVFDTPAKGAASKGIFGLAFGDGGTGVAVGGDYQQRDASAENLLLTADGGKTWRVAGSGGLSGIQYGVAYAGKSALVSTGPPSSAISTDGGASWARLEGPGYNTVSCAGALSACWAAGTRGRIARLSP
jgi:photosystem II stability/assembly factor-like uncharacterized protein